MRFDGEGVNARVDRLAITHAQIRQFAGKSSRGRQREREGGRKRERGRQKEGQRDAQEGRERQERTEPVSEDIMLRSQRNPPQRRTVCSH